MKGGSGARFNVVLALNIIITLLCFDKSMRHTLEATAGIRQGFSGWGGFKSSFAASCNFLARPSFARTIEDLWR